MKKSVTGIIKIILYLLVSIAVLTSAAFAEDITVTDSSVGAGNTVSVSDEDSFIAAIKPNTAIILESGIYDLTAASSYGGDTGNSSCYWRSLYDGYELVITGVENLRISGSNAEIVTQPRSAQVLNFVSCRNTEIAGLSVGHTVASEACEGSVISLEACSGVNLSGCSLYGCGTCGIDASDCRNISVQDTEIYHCSSSGISFYSGNGLDVSGCSFHHCGSEDVYGTAFSILYFWNAENITVQRCGIRDNYTDCLISGSDFSNVQIEDLNVLNNHIGEVFCYSGGISFQNIAFSGNCISSWLPVWNPAEECTVIIDGTACDSAALNTLYPGQLSSMGTGTVDVAPAVISRDGTKEIHVSTTDEFLSAIGSDITVYIDVPQLDLTEASCYDTLSETAGVTDFYSVDSSDFAERPYLWAECYDGYGLCIGGVSNFHIAGEAEIITTPRYVNVLSFYGCSGISLENMTLGHTPEGYCAGGVLYLQDCADVIVDSADLYGCGILGIEAWNTSALQVQDTVIHDCSYGAAQFYDSDTVTFMNCEVRSCPSYQFTLENCTNFSWDGTVMDPYSSFDIS